MQPHAHRHTHRVQCMLYDPPVSDFGGYPCEENPCVRARTMSPIVRRPDRLRRLRPYRIPPARGGRAAWGLSLVSVRDRDG